MLMFLIKNSIILGRSLTKIAKTKIVVFNSLLSMDFDGHVVKFNISDVDISDNGSVNVLGTSSPLLEESCDFTKSFVQEILSDIK